MFILYCLFAVFSFALNSGDFELQRSDSSSSREGSGSHSRVSLGESDADWSSSSESSSGYYSFDNEWGEYDSFDSSNEESPADILNHNVFRNDDENNYSENPGFSFPFLFVRALTLGVAIYYWDDLSTVINSANVVVPPGWAGQLSNALFCCIGGALAYTGIRGCHGGVETYLNEKQHKELTRALEGAVNAGAGITMVLNAMAKAVQFGIDEWYMGEAAYYDDLLLFAKVTAIISWNLGPPKGVFDFGRNCVNTVKLRSIVNQLKEESEDSKLLKELTDALEDKLHNNYKTVGKTGIYSIGLVGGYLGIVLGVLDLKPTLIFHSGVGGFSQFLTLIDYIKRRFQEWRNEKEIERLRSEQDEEDPHRHAEEIKERELKNTVLFLEWFFNEMNETPDGLHPIYKILDISEGEIDELQRGIRDIFAM